MLVLFLDQKKRKKKPLESKCFCTLLFSNRQRYLTEFASRGFTQSSQGWFDSGHIIRLWLSHQLHLHLSLARPLLFNITDPHIYLFE